MTMLKTVWTKQGKAVMQQLESKGIYTAKRERIINILGEEAPFFIPAYEWLNESAKKYHATPQNVGFPIWVSCARESIMLPDQHTVILEIELPEEEMIYIDMILWSKILNCAYLPSDERDALVHQQLLKDYNIDNVQAVTTSFYPIIKRKIIESWQRLFLSKGDERVAIIWEVRQEWVKQIRQ